MTTQHTPEPWAIDKDDENNFSIWAEKRVCNLYNSIGTPLDQAEANASRIVACVNACAGMEDPAAEIERLKAQRAELVMDKADIAMQGADAAIQGSDATIQRNNLIKQRADLIIQRDTLLKAIKSHLDLYNAGLLTHPQLLEEHTLRLAELYTDIINA